MSQTNTIPSFSEVIKTITFFKPELRLFLMEVMRELGKNFTPSTFISLVDILDPKLDSVMHSRLFREILGDKRYNVIELSANQLPTLLMTAIAPPDVLIIHCNQDEEEIFLPTDRTKFFILIDTLHPDSSLRRIRMIGSSQDVVIFHKRSPLTQMPLFINHQTSMPILQPLLQVDYRTGYTNPRLAEQLKGRFRDKNSKHSDFPEALIRSLGDTDELDEGKELYLISNNSNRPKGFTLFSSIIASQSDGITVTSIKTSTEERIQQTRTIVVHGRLKATKDRQLFKIDIGQKVWILFPDMSQKEIDSISLNHSVFYGNDRNLKSGAELIGFVPSLYFTDGLTIGQQIFNRFSLKTESPLREPSQVDYIGLSLVDNYFSTIQLKSANDFFEYMVIKYATALEEAQIGFERMNGTVLGGLVQAVRNRIQSESQIQVNQREYMIDRIKALLKNPPPPEPYPAERAVDEPKLAEEQKLRLKYGNQKLDPLSLQKKHYHLTGTHTLSEVQYAVISGENYDCTLHNCGFIIAIGTGKVRVSSTLHSLVVQGNVEVILDNVSPFTITPSLYLFMENGTIFDMITAFKDNLTPEEIGQIVAMQDAEVIEAPLVTGAVPLVLMRSVIRNLYVRRLPENYLTAMIENLVVI